MVAEVEQTNGVKLSIGSAPGSSNNILTVRLTGTEFLAEASIGNEASNGQGDLADFFINAASRRDSAGTWWDFGQDVSFTVATESGYDGLFLRVYLGSNSNDDCDWQVNATLLLEPEQLLRFGSEISRSGPEP